MRVRVCVRVRVRVCVRVGVWVIARAPQAAASAAYALTSVTFRCICPGAATHLVTVACSLSELFGRVALLPHPPSPRAPISVLPPLPPAVLLLRHKPTLVVLDHDDALLLAQALLCEHPLLLLPRLCRHGRGRPLDPLSLAPRQVRLHQGHELLRPRARQLLDVEVQREDILVRRR